MRLRRLSNCFPLFNGSDAIGVQQVFLEAVENYRVAFRGKVHSVRMKKGLCGVVGLFQETPDRIIITNISVS